VPGIRAHSFHITDRGRRELEIMQSTSSVTEQIPLGWRILLCMSHGVPVAIGPAAKMTGKPSGQVRRVMKSLHKKGLVDRLYHKTRTSFGHDIITHLYRIAKLGRQVLDAGPDAYLRTVIRRVQAHRRRPASRGLTARRGRGASEGQLANCPKCDTETREASSFIQYHADTK